MTELAHWMADLADCVWCGKPCGPDDWDEDGNPIHEECYMPYLEDREGRLTDQTYERYRETLR